MKEEKLVVVLFSLDDDGYYIETVESRNIEEIKENWEVGKVIDEASDWRNYKLTREELKNPTIMTDEVLAVIQILDEHV